MQMNVSWKWWTKPRYKRMQGPSRKLQCHHIFLLPLPTNQKRNKLLQKIVHILWKGGVTRTFEWVNSTYSWKGARGCTHVSIQPGCWIEPSVTCLLFVIDRVMQSYCLKLNAHNGVLCKCEMINQSRGYPAYSWRQYVQCYIADNYILLDCIKTCFLFRHFVVAIVSTPSSFCSGHIWIIKYWSPLGLSTFAA